MARRAFLYAVLGWGIPFILVLPMLGMREPVGGASAIAAGAVWLLVLGPIGCAIAGWQASRIEDQTVAFWSGLAGIALALVALLTLDALVPMVSVGGAGVVLILPLAVGFGLGFAFGVFVRRHARR